MDKPKQPLTEERLKKPAEARKKALEVKKMKGDIARAKKQEKKEALEKEYEEVVKKKTVKKEVKQIEETDKDIYSPPQEMLLDKVESESEEEMTPAPSKPSTLKQKKIKTPSLEGLPTTTTPQPNYKQMYYQHKLSMLQQKQEEEQFKQQYARLPPYAHAIDIAKQSIKERVDKTIYDQVYKQLFSS